jgi:uncharacterized secreted protein with C-terminal beta-propeller domain
LSGKRNKRARLDAERLEDRFMMSANAAAATSAPDIPTAVDVFVAGDAVTLRAAQERTATDSATQTSHRFQSDAEFEDWLVDAAVAQYGHLFGQRTYQYSWGWRGYGFSDVLLFSGSAVVRGNTIAALDSLPSSTNVQVAGVDEADLVETGGEYLYIISGQDLVIVKADVGDDLRIMSRVHLDQRPVGMYLSGNRLALISSSEANDFLPVNQIVMPLLATTFRFDESAAAKPTTTVTILDIADRAAPTLVQKTEMDGRLVTSRTVDGQLRLVLTNDIRLPMPIARPLDDQISLDEPNIRPLPVIDTRLMIADMAWWPEAYDSIYETQEEYLARARAEILKAIQPQIRSLALDGGVISESSLFDATDMYRPESLFDSYMTTIATINLASNESGPVDTTTIITGGPVQIYATAESLYVFAQKSMVRQEMENAFMADVQLPATSVWKFDFNPDTHEIQLVAEGEFSGRLLNQFAADEHDGYLRVVTQDDGWRGAGQSVHVLQQIGGKLEVVGTVDGIAPNEQIYSVRFVEDRVFFVTFRKVDPLFAVDLSDPENPEIVGELHIPGFSDYLQPIDENHLLAIGRNADEATGWFHELQVSIFDVSDLTDPQLAHRYSFGGGRSTITPVAGDRWLRGDGDHHAVSYFASDDIFAIPIYTAEENSVWWDGDQADSLFEAGHGGLQVFRIDVDAGFVPLGIIEHDTLVERSVRIGDHLFAISSGTVSVHELTNPGSRLGDVNIAAESAGEPVALKMYKAPVEVLALPSGDARGERPALRTEWSPVAPPRTQNAPSESVRTQYVPPAKAAAFASLSRSPLRDVDLINTIAIDKTSALNVVLMDDAGAFDETTADDVTDIIKHSEEAEQRAELGRIAFRPISTRFASSLLSV